MVAERRNGLGKTEGRSCRLQLEGEVRFLSNGRHARYSLTLGGDPGGESRGEIGACSSTVSRLPISSDNGFLFWSELAIADGEPPPAIASRCRRRRWRARRRLACRVAATPVSAVGPRAAFRTEPGRIAADASSRPSRCPSAPQSPSPDWQLVSGSVIDRAIAVARASGRRIAGIQRQATVSISSANSQPPSRC